MLRYNLFTSIEEVIASSEESATLSNEQTAAEIERVWFAKIGDFSQFDRAAKSETHEQWEYRLFRDDKPIGTLRSRAIDDGTEYEMTIKTYRKDGAGVMESNLGSTKDVHDVIAALSDRVLRKTRYIFPVVVKHDEEDVELKWEVDVFHLPDGSFDPWVKIDLEIPEEKVLTPTFPFQAEEIINASFDANVTAEQLQTIDAIFDRVKASQ